ncbi:acylneuraminate cytidylyltransferase family protein [Flavobacterium silvisoli]|uniref:Acylneuraminate cytidylyltransferase family protein n=1 Tax=Flavobacterium silvisoli TaxID=2529433 RepID=A0A4Q9YZU7_9FLAO|nr:acylneuraminate cytidylyltransferase family protein [Flavobacterium silvisoli]TBX69249.1 acylneuraminate cytidylyltransferase family protein [Flavobacterium silvisoli]
MRILGIIPARGGSKGVPRKNIKLLGKMPLIEYTIHAAKESELLTDVIVSTDDEEIAIAAEISGCKPPFIRPSELAQDTSTSIEVVQHAIDFFEKQNIFFDAVCLLQPTSPFREKGFIDAAIRKFIEKQSDSLVSVLPVPHEYNPHWTFEETQEGLLKIATGDAVMIPRRQDLPKAFHRDGSVYITKTSVIKNGSFLGESVAYIESNPDFYVNIDTMEDWKQAESLIIKLGW